MMNEGLQNAFSRCLDNGATREEFWAGRKKALAEAAARSKKHAEAAEAAREERIEHLMERGYTRAEAIEKLRFEAYEAHDSMGGNPVVRVKRYPIQRVVLRVSAPKN